MDGWITRIKIVVKYDENKLREWSRYWPVDASTDNPAVGHFQPFPPLHKSSDFLPSPFTVFSIFITSSTLMWKSFKLFGRLWHWTHLKLSTNKKDGYSSVSAHLWRVQSWSSRIKQMHVELTLMRNQFFLLDLLIRGVIFNIQAFTCFFHILWRIFGSLLDLCHNLFASVALIVLAVWCLKFTN